VNFKLGKTDSRLTIRAEIEPFILSVMGIFRQLTN
jgi:hypothetical protein